MPNYVSIRSLIWLVVCVLVLLAWVAMAGLNESSPDTGKAEAMTYVVVAMSILTFPIGVIWAVLLALAAAWAPGIQSSPWLSVLVYWIGATVLGYIQWFIAVPWIKAKRARRAHQAVQ